MLKSDRQIIKEAFLFWNDTELRRLKRYADSGKKFLCGDDYLLYSRLGLG